MASPEDIKSLSKVLDIPVETLESQLSGFPDRGRALEMPPKDPLVYRLYEIVQNYGYAYKAVLNEKFGDGIMSAISFSTKVEKETDEKGEWAKITLRGKWYVHIQAGFRLPCSHALGCHTLDSSPDDRLIFITIEYTMIGLQACGPFWNLLRLSLSFYFSCKR